MFYASFSVASTYTNNAEKSCVMGLALYLPALKPANTRFAEKTRRWQCSVLFQLIPGNIRRAHGTK